MLRVRRNAGRCVTPSGVRRPDSVIDCWLTERFMVRARLLRGAFVSYLFEVGAPRDRRNRQKFGVWEKAL